MRDWKIGLAGAALALGLAGCAYPTNEPDRYYYAPPSGYVAPSAGFYYSDGYRSGYRDRGYYRGGKYYRRGW